MNAPLTDLQFQVQEIENQMKDYFPFEIEWINLRKILLQYKKSIKILENGI
jgi:hypothetical protein